MAALPMAQSGRHSYLRTFSKILLISLLFAAIIPLSVRSSSLKSPALRPQPDVVLSKTTVEKSEISRDLTVSANITRLQRRDQYACKKGTPCKQDACCGSFDADGNGECGLGPTWCGADCDSKCDARAECGSWADPVGKTCPLNVCCSPYGFCGSTAGYCDASSGCQSNCGVDPPVPGGKSSSPVLNRVVGYYESWSNSRTCHAFPPSAIPVDGLTHVNFAFGYIDPSSLKITSMDSSTPEDLFTQVTDIRTQSSGDAGVEIFISIGGWSFSDNGTTTQDVFGSIAADAEKRQEFANNLVLFMKQFGFDGVDIDWEYPGAPDRGGKVADTKNYVLLLKTLRETFSASGRGNYGITFTIPSSYWYLRWFDLPGMVDYVDWINLMSYDLHGVWDSEDPIGNIIQGHTNLTEIKQSIDLLWRVQIPPAKVVLGLGFYGRSFQLSDKGCSKPGCEFKGAAAAGPCTASAGTLAYFEIMDIIKKEKPKVQYDTAAAVNYIQFGASNDQWVSYDDETTFKQKVDFANSVGLGGVMIWSIDQDDNDFTALSGLVGKSLPSFAEQLKKTAAVGTNKWASQNGQKCVMTDCSDHPNGPSGYNLAPNGGAFPDTCSGGNRRYIYCPVDAMPSECQWRGSGSCHGQCHAGEVTLFHSRHGSESCLRPGQQAFCCTSNTWASLIGNCAWNGIDATTCPDDKPYDISYRYQSVSICPGGAPPCVIKRYKEEFCCSYNFQGCHWVGKGTCDDNECSDTDIELVLDSAGATGSSCGGSSLSGRVKPLCCNTPNSLSPFLPVPLENLFPTLPPTTNIPVFDSQTIASGISLVGQSNSQAFGLVVIDGPPDAVTSLSKRDGSHIQFLDCDQQRGDGQRTARFVCNNSSDKSNCDDMHQGGLAGTILKMPEECGFATYAVGHVVSPSSSQDLPKHLKRRAPPNAVVYDLEYSYDFSLTKRDSGDIFVRIDYSDSHDYYDQVVSAVHQKRDLHPRFWSKATSVWKNLLQNLRVLADDSFSPSISKDNFDILLYGNDGSNNKCKGSDADGFLKIGISGSVSSSIKWGVTFVGTIAPSLNLEEAYSYFDSNPKLTGTLTFDGKGVLKIGAGESASLFQSTLTNYEFSHPGIVSFQPQLNVGVQLLGKGEIDGKFTVDFAQGNQATLRINAPLAVGDFGGSAAGKTPNNAFQGDVNTGAPTSSASSKQKRQSGGGLADGTLFALQSNLENSLMISLFGYDTTVMTAGASLNAKVPHAIRVINNGGAGRDQIAVIDGDLQALGEVFQTGSIATTWTDDVSHPLGAIPQPNQIHLGSSNPPTREAPRINGYAIFGDKDYILCSDNDSGSATLICTYDLHSIDPGLDIDPDTAGGNSSNTKKRSVLDLMARGLTAYDDLEERSRTSGASQGYAVYNPNGNGEFFTWHSATYPSGNNGDDLDEENGRTARYGIANPADCTDGSVSDQANVNNPNYQYVTEHPVERQTIPVFLQYAMTGQLDLQDGNIHQSTLTRVTFDSLANNFNSDYRIWAPGPNSPIGSGAADVADSLGSSNDADPLANLEANLNGYKAIVWDSFTNPTSDRVFDDLLTTDQQNTEQALSLLRAGFAAFNYLNDPNIHNYIVNIHQNIQAALGNYDAVYNDHFNPATRQNITALWNEFFPLWLQRIVNYHRRYLRARLTSLSNVWTPVAANPNSSAQQRAVANAALNDIQTMQGQLNTVVTIDMTGIP